MNLPEMTATTTPSKNETVSTTELSPKAVEFLNTIETALDGEYSQDKLRTIGSLCYPLEGRDVDDYPDSATCKEFCYKNLDKI